VWRSLHRFDSVRLSVHSQMAIALAATGLWLRVDVPATPNAVVVCVVIFNAAFGYR
jgi:hypothetical protein